MNAVQNIGSRALRRGHPQAWTFDTTIYNTYPRRTFSSSVRFLAVKSPKVRQKERQAKHDAQFNPSTPRFSLGPERDILFSHIRLHEAHMFKDLAINASTAIAILEAFPWANVRAGQQIDFPKVQELLESK